MSAILHIFLRSGDGIVNGCINNLLVTNEVNKANTIKILYTAFKESKIVRKEIKRYKFKEKMSSSKFYDSWKTNYYIFK